MHHDASRDAPPTSFIKPHAQDKHGGAAKALFCKNIMEACEAREHGGDSNQKHQVEGTIMQAKEWTRTFGRCNPVEHVVTKQQSKHECTGESLIQLFVRVLKFVVHYHLRLSHQSRFFAQQNTS
jgi:hypothetical protein